MFDAEKAPQFLASTRGHREEMLQTLAKFVRAESPTGSKDAVDRFGEIVAAEWRKLKANVQRVRQRHQGDHWRITWPVQAARSRERQLLVVGHLDTVYGLGTLRDMPFRISRGRVYGPGVFDMKGGLVIALFAAKALAHAHCLPSHRVMFLWTSDEETGSASSRALIERETRRSAAALVLEPASGLDGRLKTARKGVGTAVLSVTGRAAHAGVEPGAGINAIHELALQIQTIARLNSSKHGTTICPTVIDGGTRSNVIPAEARATFDLRATRATDMRDLERKLRALRPILPGAQIAVQGGFSRPPLERSASAALFARARNLAGAMGLPLEETSTGGGSDGNFTAALGIPTLDGLGAVGEGAHSANENIVASALPERAALLAALIADL